MTKLWFLGLLCACGTTDSSSLLTSGMSAEMSAQAAGDGTTTVTAELFSGYPEQLIFVDLKGSDMLIATSGTESMSLEKSQLLTLISYRASFPTDADGTEFTIELSRTVDAGAPSSTATLPSHFTLGTVPSSASRAASLTVTWSPSGTTDMMSWDAKGDCINDATGTMSDTGSVTIAANTITKKVVQGQQVPDSCSVTLSVYRTSDGMLDSHFGKGGGIVGQQIRSAMLTTMP